MLCHLVIRVLSIRCALAIAPRGKFFCGARGQARSKRLHVPHLSDQSALQEVIGRSLSVEEFNSRVRTQNHPVLVREAVDLCALDASTVPLARDAFIASFGHLDAPASNGRFDAGRKEQQFNVFELLSLPQSDLKYFCTDNCFELHRQVLNRSRQVIPSFLDGFSARPIMSVGPKGSSTWFHEHDETWFMMLAGRKAWWVGDQTCSSNKVSGVDPSMLLGSSDLPAGIKFIVLNPGDLLYLPAGIPHATYNLDEFVFGLGSQGHTEKWPAIIQAAQHGNIDLVEKHLVESSDGVRIVNQAGETALHRAVLRGDSALVELLTRDRYKFCIGDKKGKNPLHIAALHGHASIAARLLESGAKLNERRQDGEHPLNLAVGGHISVTELLLQQRADPNLSGLSNVSPLHRAADSQSRDSGTIIKMLLASRADPGVRETSSGQQPLHWAAEKGHLQAARELARGGGNCRARASDGAEPIHTAARGGHARVVAWLVKEQNVNVGVVDDSGISTSHLAAMHGHVDILQFCLDSGADVERESNDGFMPLEFAIAAGHDAIMDVFLSRFPVPD